MVHQVIVFAVIISTLVLFIDGRIRYEYVSIMSLLFLTITGVISPEETFSGFGHPAVITVASVFVISAALIKSGIVERLVILLNGKSPSLHFKIAGLMYITAFLSAFMNNVGALALILPVALRIAKDSKTSPSKFLMPVAFASLLGGMVTIIGTPPNLIISNYRVQFSGQSFNFFDFSPVGITVVIIGIGFTVLLGIKFIPERKSQREDELFNIGEYLSEVVVTETSKMAGKRIRDFYEIFKVEVGVLSINRNKYKIIIPKPNERLFPGDVLIIKTDSLELKELINRTGLSLKGAKLDFLESMPNLKSDEFSLVEVVLRDDSLLIGRTALEVKLRNRYNVNLVAVSRKGELSIGRLKRFRFKAGDILLLQAPVSILQDIYNKLSCLPLAERSVKINVDKKGTSQFLPLGLFFIGIVFTTIGFIPVQIAFSAVAILLVTLKMITPREFYEAIEWPTILLLGTLLPLGSALQKSGAADTIAGLLTKLSFMFSPAWMIVILMLITMIITNLISSTATAILMGPVALSLASSLGFSPDPFLMGVCIAASSAFLTPIGHQSNMLVMGPGGYKFTDYWRLGLPLCIIVIVCGIPLILLLWRF